MLRTTYDVLKQSTRATEQFPSLVNSWNIVFDVCHRLLSTSMQITSRWQRLYMLTVCRVYGWTCIPEPYRNLPVFTLDDSVTGHQTTTDTAAEHDANMTQSWDTYWPDVEPEPLTWQVRIANGVNPTKTWRAVILLQCYRYVENSLLCIQTVRAYNGTVPKLDAIAGSTGNQTYDHKTIIQFLRSKEWVIEDLEDVEDKQPSQEPESLIRCHGRLCRRNNKLCQISVNMQVNSIAAQYQWASLTCWDVTDYNTLMRNHMCWYCHISSDRQWSETWPLRNL